MTGGRSGRLCRRPAVRMPRGAPVLLRAAPRRTATRGSLSLQTIVASLNTAATRRCVAQYSFLLFSRRHSWFDATECDLIVIRWSDCCQGANLQGVDSGFPGNFTYSPTGVSFTTRVLQPSSPSTASSSESEPRPRPLPGGGAAAAVGPNGTLSCETAPQVRNSPLLPNMYADQL